MSSDLLAEFDSFYKAPSNGQPSPSNPPKNDISFFGSSNGGGQKWQGGNQTQAQWNNTPAKPSGDIWGDMSSFATPTNPPPQTAPQNDIWDSFKTVPVQGKMPAPSQTFNASRPGLAQSRGMNFGSTKSAVERRPTLDLFSNNIIHGTLGTPATKVDQFATPRLPATKKSSVGEVLFDADEEQDDDEFGDFEDATAPLDPGPQPIDLLFGATTLESKPFNRPSDLLMSPNAVLNPLPYPQAPKSPSFQERNPFAELGLATTPTTATTKDEKRKSESPVTAWPTYEPKPPKPAPFRDSSVPTNELDDDWGDFADLPPETPAAKTPKDTPSVEADSWGWDWADKTVDSAPRSQGSAPPRAFKPAPSSVPKAARTPKISTPMPAPTPASVPVTVPVPKKNKPPPTNIPPPSVLLTLFPPLFNLPQSTLFQPVADQPFSLRNRVLSDPTTLKFLRAYLLIATVAARIIAGRKLRWKRDSHLSQAMKIGPAGGKSGMKLTGVDKAEATRESREATEVVRVWKEQLGRLRSAVAAANSSNHDILSHMVIPEIGEVMHINTLKGAMTDVKVCLLCGLKREERIAKVDIDELIEDSFGEWWIGYWGHRDCRNFWEEHESKLKHH